MTLAYTYMLTKKNELRIKSKYHMKGFALHVYGLVEFRIFFLASIVFFSTIAGTAF